MRRRCTDPEDKDWAAYGGRGVTVCDRWATSFSAFWSDVREGYDPRLTLGRKNNDGPYSKENCRWETPVQQGRNKRSTVFLDTPKGRMSVAEAAETFKILPVTLYARLNRYGWSVDRALTTPVKTSTT